MHKVINSFEGDYFFLSNFYAAQISYDGMFYPSNEHAFQAAKTLDFKQRLAIAQCATPGKAKRNGRLVELRKDWEECKYNIMEEICMIKFVTRPDLREELLQTGYAELIEGNNWGDKVWGVCDGEGTNWLGKILMNIRSKLK